jgi:signal transduction histidine kinase/CheY-like chemotaxis protein
MCAVVVCGLWAAPCGSAGSAPEQSDARPALARDTLPFALSDADRSWLASLPVLRVGFHTKAYPYSFLAADGEPRGIAADYLALVARELGLHIKYVFGDSFAALTDRMNSGDIDMLAASYGGPLLAPRDWVDTRPYLQFPIVIAAREGDAINGLEDLAGATVAVYPWAPAPLLDALARNRTTVVQAQSPRDALRALAASDVRAYVADLFTVDPLIQEYYPGTLRVAAPVRMMSYLSFAVSRPYARLAPIISNVLQTTPAEVDQDLRRTWLSPRYSYGIPLAIFWRGIVPAMVIVVLMALTISFGYLHLRREIRQRRAAELRLAAARDLAEGAAQAKAAFFAMMSHEIRTPLSGVIGMLDLLKRTEMEEGQRQIVTSVDTAASSLLRILDDVLDFSKVEANRMTLECVPLDPRALVESVVLVIGEPARRRGIATKVSVDGAVAREVRGDPLRIRQVLSNLVSNAAKFTHHGEIRVGLAVVADTATHQVLRFSVTDTGIGIPRDKLATIMAPFGQADSATARRYGGHGLGLPVSARLAALMGGELRVSSDAGAGVHAEFVCRFEKETTASSDGADIRPAAVADAQCALPADSGADTYADADADADADTDADTDTEPEAVAGMDAGVRAADSDGRAGAAGAAGAADRILVAEDHAINRDLLCRQLAALGYRYDAVEDAASALDALRRRPYAMLLTDCQMTPMDGRTLVREWRAAERFALPPGVRPMPAVALSAARPSAGAETDFDGYLLKPVRLEALQRELAKWLPAPAPQETTSTPGETPLAHLSREFASPDAARTFVERSIALLREDLATARTQVLECEDWDIAPWLHRVTGALSVLGDWPILAQAAALQSRLVHDTRVERRMHIDRFMQEFAQTLDQIERDLREL